MKKIIQIIEDEPSLSTPIQSALEKAGYEVFVEATGDKAVDAVKLHKPSLVLLDIMLPGKTGWDIIEDIGKEYKVIIMSNLDTMDRKLDFMDKGALDYLVKSNISLAEILKKVKAVIGQRRLPMSKDTIGSRLKQQRLKLGLTQAAVAKKADTDTNYYAKIERGEATPSLKTFTKILKALKASSSDILSIQFRKGFEHLFHFVVVQII